MAINYLFSSNKRKVNRFPFDFLYTFFFLCCLSKVMSKWQYSAQWVMPSVMNVLSGFVLRPSLQSQSCMGAFEWRLRRLHFSIDWGWLIYSGFMGDFSREESVRSSCVAADPHVGACFMAGVWCFPVHQNPPSIWHECESRASPDGLVSPCKAGRACLERWILLLGVSAPVYTKISC